MDSTTGEIILDSRPDQINEEQPGNGGIGNFGRNIETLRIGHINTANCRAAIMQLSQTIIEERLDIVSINEPYCCEGVMGYLPRNCIRIAAPGKPRAGVLVIGDLRSVCLHRAPNMVVAEINYKNDDSIIFCSIYVSPSQDINPEIQTLEGIIGRYNNKEWVINGDFNAKSPLWGGSIEDERREIVRDLISINDIELLNNNNSIPTFDCS